MGDNLRPGFCQRGSFSVTNNSLDSMFSSLPPSVSAAHASKERELTAGEVREERRGPLSYGGQVLPHGAQCALEERVEGGGEGWS